MRKQAAKESEEYMTAKEYVINMCNCLADTYNLYIDVRFSTRMTRTIGRCERTRERPHVCTLSFSEVTLQRLWNKNLREEIDEIVFHEVGHAISSIHAGHGREWASNVQRLGGHPSRLYETEIGKLYRYIYECPHCHKKFYKKRKLNKRGACSDCCEKYNMGRYTEEYAIELKEDKGKVGYWD